MLQNTHKIYTKYKKYKSKPAINESNNPLIRYYAAQILHCK